MREVPGALSPGQAEPPARELVFLTASESWPQVFWQNLREQFRRPQPRPVDSAPAAFWADVFVANTLPWRRFFQSGIFHVLALAMIWAGTRLLVFQSQVTDRPSFQHFDVVYYSPSEYLPPLDTRRQSSASAGQTDPEHSVQPIISVPPAAENRSRTVITPPNIQLERDVPLPNMVAVFDRLLTDSRMPIGPVPVVPASEISRLTPRMERSVIAPPPDLRDNVPAPQQNGAAAPQSAVIAPPPAIEVGQARRLGDLNIGHSTVIAPAPQLSLDEQRALSGRSSPAQSARSAQVIAPPPSLGVSGGSRGGTGMIALSLHPAVSAPASPARNRRGTFAATPEGHREASGAPGNSSAAGSSGSADAGKSNATDGRSGKNRSNNLPSGLYVGKTPNSSSPVAGDQISKTSSAYTVNPKLLASARPPRPSAHTLQSESESKLSREERAVFGDRKLYSLSLNMPNLNSSGGSWIVRFAALKADSESLGSSSRAASSIEVAPESGELSAPSATRKVDPAYPLELMRQSVAGTVILYAVIRADGRVAEVRVLRSADERLDRFACEAIAKWKFEPATRNGTPVDVEATFSIPFRPTHVGSAF